MKRINVLWAVPLILPCAFILMFRFLWRTLGLSWEANWAVAGIVVAWAAMIGVVSAVVVCVMQYEGSGIWWTFKEKGKSDD